MKPNSTNSGFLRKLRLCFSWVLLSAACSVWISGCATAQTNQAEVPSAPNSAQQPALQSAGDAEAIQAQQQQLVKALITVTAPVKKMLKYDDRGLPHEKFLLMLSNGTTILVAHNTKMAPYVPVQPGDVVTVHGEYIWNAKGGLIHWTHHSDSPNHQSGFIDFNGKRYE